MGELDGARALVTGGGSGIGRATCRRMVAEGATVAVLDVEKDRAEEVAAEVGGLPLSVDVTDTEALKDAVDQATTRLGGLSLVFANAGWSTMAGIAEWDPAEWDRIVRINLGGVWATMRAAAPHLLAGGGGAIVSTASISGTRPSAGEAPYATAKAGVVALTASAALEYAPHIRVNAVAPGMIRTGLTSVLLDLQGMTGHYERITPLDRIGTPEDVADVVVFLCSERARFVTGQTVVVDGGMTLHGAGVDGLFDRFFRGGAPPA
ncbi:MAG TPA: SDR family NAD(P)-dependent oxidoreductase [Acidimicrobiales bacterium]|nr:SDR family NAD(P)-dependent oxidoreductase [Acidimicrobiales bacterium]